jgi:hypothetical protein
MMNIYWESTINFWIWDVHQLSLSGAEYDTTHHQTSFAEIFDHVTAVSSLMDRLLDLSKNSLQYGNSMCPSMIRKLKVIVYF